MHVLGLFGTWSILHAFPLCHSGLMQVPVLLTGRDWPLGGTGERLEVGQIPGYFSPAHSALDTILCLFSCCFLMLLALARCLSPWA